MKVIRNENIDNLLSENYLEILLPKLGLNDRHKEQYPNFLHKYCGEGVCSWQYPNQFSKYLAYIANCNIKSYLEIGCHKGGTFIITVEYLSRFNKLDRCLAVDNWYRDEMNNYSKEKENVIYLNCKSQDEQFVRELNGKIWDLAFIDGDHSYEAVLEDFNTIRQKCKYVAFHDIKNDMCPGVVKLWNEIKKHYDHEEWTDQYPEVLNRLNKNIMGIGLVKNIHK